MIEFCRMFVIQIWSDFWGGDVGDDLPYRTGPGGVPAQGCTTDHGEAAPAANGWELGIPSARERKRERQVPVGKGIGGCSRHLI